MTPEEIYTRLHERFGERIVSYSATAVDPYVVVEASALRAVATYLRYDSAMQCDSLMCLSGVDYGPEKSLGVVYNLHSTTLRHKITLKRSEEHTSELQSLRHLVCRLLLEKKTYLLESLMS